MAEICHLGCWRQNAKTRFSGKLSNLELYWRRIIGSRTWAFQKIHYWTHKIQDGWDTPSWKSTWRHFFLPRVVGLGYNFADWCRMTCRLRWYGGNRNQVQNSNMADVWANSMAYHPRPTCHIAGCSGFRQVTAVQSPGEINVMIVPHCKV